MALIQIVREVGLSPVHAWARVTNWQRHGEFVPLTRITVTDDGFDAFTGFGKVGFHDPMAVVRWEEPSLCRLEKRGRIVTGWAELTVEPVEGGSRIVWREDIAVWGVPRLFDPLIRASSGALFSRVIDGLLR